MDLEQSILEMMQKQNKLLEMQNDLLQENTAAVRVMSRQFELMTGIKKHVVEMNAVKDHQLRIKHLIEQQAKKEGII